MSVMVMLEVPVLKAKMEGFLDVVRELLKETRACDGCQKVETFVEEESGRVILMELWETAGHHQACHNWRMENGLVDTLSEFVTGEVQPRTFAIRQDV